MNRPSPRLRRLRADYNALFDLRSQSTVFDFEANGNPPDRYLIRFKGRGLYRPEGTKRISISNEHQVTISLGASYPRLMPELQWKSPIFHPNVSASGVVCLGGYGTYWVPSLNLDEMCEMLWDMLRYANYDVDSPYNRDAANWARFQRDFRFPVDPRPIRDRIASGEVRVDALGAAIAPQPVTAQPVAAPPKELAPPPVGPPPAAPPVDPAKEILFLDEPNEVVNAEIVDGDDPDVFVID
ncbi:MAG: hypothetical protein KDA41_17815 [Planctomycetales bacterium]|nr:hypothetical protein [Planctomycetales bacterium]